MFSNDSVAFNRDFRIGHPSMYESQLGTFHQAPAFWPCADKMVTYIL